MNAYVSRLIARAHGELPVARPRLPGRFESTRTVGAFSVQAPSAPEDRAATSLSLRPLSRVPDLPARARSTEPAVGNETGPTTYRTTNEALETPRPAPLAKSVAGKEGRSAEVRTTNAMPERANLALPRPTRLSSSTDELIAPAARPREAPKTPLPDAPRRVLHPESAIGSTAAHSAPPRPGGRETAIGEAPVIHVTIGRVDVRAVTPASAKPPPIVLTKPRASLDDYLARTRRR
jgi:hypothetical protein